MPVQPLAPHCSLSSSVLLRLMRTQQQPYFLMQPVRSSCSCTYKDCVGKRVLAVNSYSKAAILTLQMCIKYLHQKYASNTRPARTRLHHTSDMPHTHANNVHTVSVLLCCHNGALASESDSMLCSFTPNRQQANTSATVHEDTPSPANAVTLLATLSEMKAPQSRATQSVCEPEHTRLSNHSHPSCNDQHKHASQNTYNNVSNASTLAVAMPTWKANHTHEDDLLSRLLQAANSN